MTAAVRAIGPRMTRARSGAVLLGPALVAAAAYVDPGNVATNTAAGASYGYLLVWVVVVANLMAGLVQYLAAKLGLVTGMSLPEALRVHLPGGVRIAYWVQAELVTMATDLAEVLGGAIALHLLFDLPLIWGGVITAAVSVVILTVRDGGQRRFERVVAAMLAVVAIGFVAGLFVSPPDPAATFGGLVPGFGDAGGVLIAAGMLGATVMPHAIYVHSALARDRHGRPAPGPERARLLAVTKADVTVALLIAGAVNLGLLLLGAAALPADLRTASLEGVHTALGQNLGAGIALLFAVALLSSGLASTAVGCYSGSVVMAGLLKIRVPLLARRVVTAIPALIVLSAGADPTWALILSQVVLSFGIPFALIPLVVLTSRRSVMGDGVNGRFTVAVAGLVVAAIVALNLALIWLTVTGQG
ncbi:Nramp family divalent metal transporter [Pseudonocardia acidicola]|uniref:Nramp family divalent metal transporter n=1 Tax=Pseudonocardia acidicola TaxID=2724939 RepID=A0ABX1SFK7_9PSEU|nr:Nramp family divalent metal transporter [Pseudonocardia acidicola]NMH99327.1 Nramp family divalent metal transporter [Pseudonocardia acidicola]